MNILKRDFYEKSTLKVAQCLLGKILYYKSPEGTLSGKIVETEAYLQDDPACHASRGITPRNKVMFGPPGHAYVYFTYGMHYCFNVVTQKEGVGEAVLIRAVEPIRGIEIMKKNRGTENLRSLTNGPAKLCQAFGIDKKMNGVDLTNGNLVILDSNEKPKIHRAPRIGIKNNAEKLWRFYTDSKFVSVRILF